MLVYGKIFSLRRKNDVKINVYDFFEDEND